MIKFVALIPPTLEGQRGLELLVLAARDAGVPMELGVVSEQPSRPISRRKGQSTKKGKPKKYKMTMSVKMAKEPEGVPPKTRLIHQALLREFGTEPFIKRTAKAAVLKRLGAQKGQGASGHITRLMESGGMVPA